jgi:pimeloyl-ACP methyl ester carboxylesterase
MPHPRNLALAALFACAASCARGELDDASSAEAASTGFSGGFNPRHAPYGGFGGEAGCRAVRTPVVLVHGNSESADDWRRPDSRGGPSVPARFAAAGYRGCELFAVTWLPAAGRALKQLHFHDEAKADLVGGFLSDVLAYTSARRVDVIGHSMGVTVALHALERSASWARVRRFVSIAGGLRGLSSCVAVGPGNPLFPTCGAQNLFDADVFGFYPALNPRMEPGGFRARPSQHPEIAFYGVRAGASDEILCPSCESALFDAAPNVRAQLDVGEGFPMEGDHDDTSGVGHIRARRDTGLIQVNLLATGCAGTACCAGYDRRCVD